MAMAMAKDAAADAESAKDDDATPSKDGGDGATESGATDGANGALELSTLLNKLPEWDVGEVRRTAVPQCPDTPCPDATLTHAHAHAPPHRALMTHAPTHRALMLP
jgi:hypothetical protein